jgi:prepilin-type N-terminal cleavage/methylation domain-containing protein
MQTYRPRAFTLIELLVVIALILILVSISVPIIGEIQSLGDRAKCASNLKQIGIDLIASALKFEWRGAHKFPEGGQHPGDWGDAAAVISDDRLLTCPAPDPQSPFNPKTNATTYSYGYVGNLTPVYVCGCSSCNGEKRIWKLYWAGVDYTGDHQDTNHPGGSRDTNWSGVTNCTLSANLRFQDGDRHIDDGEPTVPTVPVHQDDVDLGKFGGSDRAKFRTERALRQVPETAEDQADDLPLAFDLCILHAAHSNIASDLPSGASSWETAHTYVTPDNKTDLLWGNHCDSSASSKDGWGANILFCSGSVKWKDWEELRFQVMAYPGTTSSDRYLRYYFFY